MKKWLHTDLAVLVGRLAVLYVLLFVCRLVFWAVNAAALGPVAWAEVPQLLRGAFAFDTVSLVYANAVLIFFSLLPLRVRERAWYQRCLFWYYVVVNAAVLAINYSDIVYFRYTAKRFTADELFFFGNDNTAHVALKFAAENWWLVGLWALSVAALVAAFRWIGPPRPAIRSRRGYYAAGTAVLMGAVALCVGGVRGGFGRSVRPITLSNATQYTPSVQKANLILSNPFCIIRTMGKTRVEVPRYFDAEELAAIYTPYHFPAADAPALGRRNIVILILESFSAEHSALLNPDLYPAGDPGFTPFLDSLMRGGYTFTEAYSNGRKSIDALPSVLASIPSFATPFMLLPQSLGTGRPLPAILRDEGYTTAFFNGSPRGSMGFGAYANQAGVTEIFSQEDYERERGTGDYDGYWGIWDEPFLSFMAGQLGRLPQPFFAAAFTLTSHHPFVVPDRYRDSLPAGRTRVHRGVAYTDMAIRRFMEQAARQPWYDSTIFVFVADHVSSETFAPKTGTPTGNTHIISFIYTPDGAVRGMDGRVSQQLDLMPTLLGLVGYRKPYFAFGRDVIGEPERLPMAVNYMNQAYQAITDSLAIFFDGQRVLGAYGRADTLQRYNLARLATPYMRGTERTLKAMVQQYYDHLSRRSYVADPEAVPVQRPVADTVEVCY